MIVRLRSCSRWLAAAWLVSQIATIAITAGVLQALPARSTLSGHCECPGSPETATCPMHSRSAPRPLHGSDCAMRQGTTPSVALLSVSPAFPMAPRATALELPQGNSPVAPATSDIRDRSARPEAPPPRS